MLLVRSGRHLLVAVSALRARFPDCEIAVVGTPGTEQLIAHAGIAPENTFVYSSRPRFTPVAFATSRTALAARRWGFTRVAVLWNDPDGRGQGNVDRTAFSLAPTGFLAITPDGSVVERLPLRQLGHEIRRAAVSLAAGVVLGALYLPAVAIAAFRRVRFAGPALQDRQDPHVGRVPRSGPAEPAAGDSGQAGRLKPAPTYAIAAADTKDEAA